MYVTLVNVSRKCVFHNYSSGLSAGFAPNQKFAAPPSCSCFSEWHLASAAGRKSADWQEVMTGCY